VSVPDEESALDAVMPGFVETMALLSENLRALYTGIAEHGITPELLTMASGTLRSGASAFDELRQKLEGSSP
jgi:hypothetical protein